MPRLHRIRLIEENGVKVKQNFKFDLMFNTRKELDMFVDEFKKSYIKKFPELVDVKFYPHIKSISKNHSEMMDD
jgi:hypothetical protein